LLDSTVASDCIGPSHHRAIENQSATDGHHLMA
jgi:hypothetical protein